MDSLISFILFTAACLVFALLASVADRRITATFAIATALYLGLDGIITEIPNLVPSLDFIGGNWNWVGKILSLAFSMVVIISLKISPDALGLRLKQEYPTLACLSLIAFVIWGATLGTVFKPVDRFRSECDQPEVPANTRPPSGSRLTAASGRSGTRPGPRTYPGTLPARPMAQRHPFASRLVRDARGLATVPYKPERSRAQLATDQDSCVAFSNAKSGPCWMQIRVVGEADPLRQALSAKSDAAGVSQ